MMGDSSGNLTGVGQFRDESREGVAIGLRLERWKKEGRWKTGGEGIIYKAQRGGKPVNNECANE